MADTFNNTIRKVTPVGTNWVVTTLGGMSGSYGTADGTGSTARFCNPNGVAVDVAGNIYVADFYFNTIRKGYPPPMFRNSEINLGQFRSVLTGPPGSVGGRGSFERSVKLAAHLDQHLCGSSEFQ